jgi:DNA uptake protein ComE-like DNA-binding protein
MTATTLLGIGTRRVARTLRRAAPWLAVAILALPGGGRAAERLDLNRATLEEIRGLPIPPEVAQGVWERREFVDWYDDVTDLLEVPGLTPRMLASLKPLIEIGHVEVTPERQRKDDLFYRFEWWEGAEGRDESLVELYKDLALDPVNVNTATLLQLQNLQNASPVDAVAIAKYRDQVGTIAHRGELRRAPGLSGWGYSNIRNFVSYEEEEDDRRLHGNYSLRLETTSYFPDHEDLFRADRDPSQGTNDNWYDRLGLEHPEPAVYQKLRVRSGRRYEAGAVTNRRLGEDDLFDTKKGYFAVGNLEAGGVRLERLVLGNYNVSWGQGVVMENTDFFSSRKSGYNFAKRYDGVLGDLSRTEQSQLRGVAAEASWWRLRGIGFYSKDDKDAILNDDGSVNQLVWMTPRIDNDELVAAGLDPMKDVLEEETWGGNLRVNLAPGCWVGVGGYESRYDRFFDPKWDPDNPGDKHPLVGDDDEDNLVAQDGEIFASYESPGKYRRVYGADFQWVLGRHVAFQGEYSELDLSGDDGEIVGLDDDGNPIEKPNDRGVFKIGDEPSALVLNTFVQYENLNVLTVYRDYDVGYDNPYQRSFSNYKRFKGTVFEDNFRLVDPLYGLVYENAAQPQAERGFYVSTRYRWADPFITTIEWDTWRRQADMSKYSRFVGRLEYRLLFPLRLKLRHKWQNREHRNLLDPTVFNNVETIWQLEYRLSRFDEIEFRYGTAYTQWPPRGRLQGEPSATGANPISGSNAEPGQLFSGKFTHHSRNGRIVVDGEIMVYQGFWWFFEKSTFRVADSGLGGIRTWVEVSDRVSDDLTLRFRVVRDNQRRNTAVDIRQFNEPVGSSIDAEDVHEVTNYFRIQADWSF